MTSLADQIRSQAAISARPGQLAALEAIADRVAELEAAQRPPLGYIVVTQADGRGPFVHGDHRLVMASESEAIAAVGRSDLPRGMRHVVAEVREVQPS